MERRIFFSEHVCDNTSKNASERACFSHQVDGLMPHPPAAQVHNLDGERSSTMWTIVCGRNCKLAWNVSRLLAL
jgi:hypothetical protein